MQGQLREDDPDDPNYVDLLRVPSLEAGFYQSASDKEWYDFYPIGGPDDPDEDSSVPQGDMYPLSTIVVHNITDHEQYNKIHQYFSQRSLEPWVWCIKQRFKPRWCGSLLGGRPDLARDPYWYKARMGG
eukprot:gene18066-24490_t